MSAPASLTSHPPRNIDTHSSKSGRAIPAYGHQHRHTLSAADECVWLLYYRGVQGMLVGFCCRRVFSLCRHSSASGSSIHGMIDAWSRVRTSWTSAGLARKNSRRRLTRFTLRSANWWCRPVLEADRVVTEDHGVDVVVEGN